MSAKESPSDEVKRRRRRPHLPADGKREATKSTQVTRRRQAKYAAEAAAAAVRETQEKLRSILAKKEREGVLVNREKLRQSYSLWLPGFMNLGYYTDIEFRCRQCGAKETWTATQQKWWYEVAKGHVHSTAVLCRNCRRPIRQRREASRRVHLEGLARKKNRPASEKPSRKRIKK